MDDNQLVRYSRQILLPEIDIEGQERLLSARVLVIGLGGLGSPVAMYLASSGVGNLTLCDHDRVDLGNLQRQIVHNSTSIGTPKTESAANTLRNLNPDLRLELVAEKLDERRLAAECARHDVVVDATDNFASRFQINRAALKAQTPLVSGAAVGFAGQVVVIDPRRTDSACYQCLFPDEGDEPRSCAENGVIAPLVGIIGSIQATEVIKLLLEIGRPLNSRLLRVDALTMEFRDTLIHRDPSCPSCGTAEISHPSASAAGA